MKQKNIKRGDKLVIVSEDNDLLCGATLKVGDTVTLHNNSTYKAFPGGEGSIGVYDGDQAGQDILEDGCPRPWCINPAAVIPAFAK